MVDRPCPPGLSAALPPKGHNQMASVPGSLALTWGPLFCWFEISQLPEPWNVWGKGPWRPLRAEAANPLHMSGAPLPQAANPWHSRWPHPLKAVAAIHPASSCRVSQDPSVWLLLEHANWDMPHLALTCRRGTGGRGLGRSGPESGNPPSGSCGRAQVTSMHSPHCLPPLQKLEQPSSSSGRCSGPRSCRLHGLRGHRPHSPTKQLPAFTEALGWGGMAEEGSLHQGSAHGGLQILGSWWKSRGTSLVAQRWRICWQCGSHKRHGFHPWVWKIPWKRPWQPAPVFLPGESHRQRSLVGYSPESDTTKET